MEDKILTIKESQANQLLTALSKLPWAQADPLIKFIQETVKPLEGEETKSTEPGEEKQKETII